MKDLFKKAREWVWLEGDPEKDQSTGLVVFGTLEVLLGILSFALSMFMLVMVSATGLGGMKPVHFWMAMGSLFFLTGWFIVMGLGSMKARRWARALILVGSWVAVFFGSLGLAYALYMLPETYNLLADSGWMPQRAVIGTLYFSVGVVVLLQVVFPLAAVAFYNLKGVQSTCERLNPNPSWTDRCPLPLLAMGFVSFLGCFSVISGVATNHVVFLFGHVVDGFVGVLVLLLVSVAFGYVGWGAFTRKMHAWWGAYALVLAVSTSLMLTFSEMEMGELYASMGYSANQIEQLSRVYPISPAVLTFISCVWGIMACIYLVWVRDCFRAELNEAEVKSYAQRKAEEEAAKPKESRRPRMRLD